MSHEQGHRPTVEYKQTAAANKPRLPWWIKPGSAVVMALQRLGIAIGPQYIISIPGRKSGLLRETPITITKVEGQRYVCTGFETDWAKNARAAGWGILSRGRKHERVALVDIPADERAAIIKKFRWSPAIRYFAQVLTVPTTPEAIDREAWRCPLFRIDPLPVANGAK